MLRPKERLSAANEHVRVRAAHQSDIDTITPFLRCGFGSAWSVDVWRRMFEYPGVESKPNVGFMLEYNGQLVGFLGAIYSDRLVAGRVEHFCNLSGWYTAPRFRAKSMLLLTSVLRQQDYTFTNFTPSETVAKVIKALGFRPLDSCKVLWGPRLYRELIARKRQVPPRHFPAYHARGVLEMLLELPIVKALTLTKGATQRRSTDQGAELFAGPEFVRPRLSGVDQRLLDEHRECGHFLVEEGEEYSYIVTVRRRLNFCRRSLADWIASDILHLGFPQTAARHWRALCRLITAHDRSQSVMADSRYFQGQPPSHGLSIPYSPWFLSRTDVGAANVDGLYTEVALLGNSFVVGN